MRNHFGRNWIPLYEVKPTVNDPLFGEILELSYGLDKYMIKYYKADDISEKIDYITKALSLMHPLRMNLQTFIKKRGAKDAQQEEFTLMMNAVAGSINIYQTNMTKIRLHGGDEKYSADYTNVSDPILQMLSFMNAVSMTLLQNRNQVSLFLMKDMLPVPLDLQRMMAELSTFKAKARLDEQNADNLRLNAKLAMKEAKEKLQNQQEEHELPTTSETPLNSFLPTQLSMPQTEAVQDYEEEPKQEVPKEKKLRKSQDWLDKLLMNGIVDQLHCKNVSEIAGIFSMSKGRTSEILEMLYQDKKVQREKLGRELRYWVSEVA